MNYLLVFPDEVQSQSLACIKGDRVKKVMRSHDLKAGITVAAGVFGGLLGRAQVLGMSSSEIHLQLALDRQPPLRLQAHLMSAIPRPQTIKKLLHLCASTGALSLSFIHAERVVPGYAQSKCLRPVEMQRELIMALEQCGDTVHPDIRIFPSLIDALKSNSIQNCAGRCFYAHTKGVGSMSVGDLLDTSDLSQIAFAIGPESGWSEQELIFLNQAGCRPLWLGERQYRVEVAAGIVIGIANAVLSKSS